MPCPMFLLEDVTKERHATGGAPAFQLEVPLFRVQTGERVALVGPSGCGKSTLMDLLVFTMRPTASHRFLFRHQPGSEADIGALWHDDAVDALGDLRKRNIGIVLQTGGLLPFLTAGENIQLPRRLTGRTDDAVINTVIDRLGIRHLLGKKPGKLSVGERQRTSIARALAHDPILVIADEPTASLDEETATETMSLLTDLVERLGVTLILSTHDTRLVERYGFRQAQHDHRPSGGGHPAISRFWYDA
ncbi:MAG: ATP-binding cassette domain-containing protein [Phaeospirillum sp.]|nr:ATP-binding cassette domain-containing protein [Phaeospirillum sp.]